MYWFKFPLIATVVSAAQTPFHSPQSTHDQTTREWDFDQKPNVNATGHLIFDTVSSLLQHWPNTRYRNGHNLIPGIVPIGTLLYHGRGDAKVPTEPQWTATDPEHSYAFCRGTKEAGCWQLTLVTTRPLNLLYFDGSSAAKMKTGPMDTQDIVAWRQILPDRYFEEKRRLQDLCDWGTPLGLDGFVRMEMDFEILLCDFTAGVGVESLLNLHAQPRGGPGRPGPGGPGGPGGPPGGPGGGGPGAPPPPPYGDHPPIPSSMVPNDIGAFGFSEVTHSGSWHNRFPGDTRIQLDIARMVSFYDTDLVPSLVPERLQQERWFHRLAGISGEDVDRVMNKLEEAVQTPHGMGSSVDWTTLVHVIVDRFATRLEMVQHLLNKTTDSGDGTEDLKKAKRVQSQLKAMTLPYNVNSAHPSSSDDLSWASPVFELCATTHTRYISTSVELTSGESLLLRSIEETNREICRVATKMWAQGVLAGLDDMIEAPTGLDDRSLGGLLYEWSEAVSGLMAWLDWSIWVKCRPECDFEEYCYLPTWPFGREDRNEDEIEKPHPRCISRFSD